MIPDELKMRLYYRAVESIAKTAEGVFDDRKIGNRIRRLGNDQLKPAIEESLPGSGAVTIGADDKGLMGAAERLISSRPFQDALENVLLQPWRVTDETFHRLNEIAAAEVGTEEAQLVTSMMGVILQGVARDLWRIREVRETYAVYFQERLVELGLEQVDANRQMQELLKDIRNGERGPARGEYVLAEAQERRAIEAGATGLTTDESLARDLLEQQLRRRAPGSRSLRMRDVVADGLFQAAGAVDWADPQPSPRPVLLLLWS